ncbi:MAG: CoA-disulfide reductase [Dysgonomonas mossii]|uniref:NADPH-dependent 2,4-dienoyl-CoA reductase/sulfur reductase-like enzyme/rhodanese-related sulfurtransferase n=1 Tax=Dysgonomonas hofstadii TaxID=637886 RepID=A0A840CRK3_9BACT|nr:NADPH-dependent 2,4-dienoyl-CoA reductase/sulfur reductase-like enzyme/rhodanese-related sulfurtransferase [Dysgonomonas hofstadii]MBS5908974.1 CoA-disulfide reductase [Dysgonomonas mossii]
MKILIVGGVAGGASVAARLRRMDEQAEIILFERGEYISYANCGLPYYIGGTIADRDNLFVQTVDGFSKRFKIDIRVLQKVICINRENKSITIQNLITNKEYTESYDKLILSTGSEPVKPPIKGIDSRKIFTLRNVPDTDKIKNFLITHKPQKAVVIGGGFIGLEMVENLHNAGLEVQLVEKADQVMAPIDFSMAAIVHQQLRQKGVELYLKEGVTSFLEEENGVRIVLESGRELISDMVIFSIGVRPDIKIVKDAGLELGTTGGIKVNSYMQTSDNNIYALGDAVEVLNPVITKQMLIPLAGPANKQARIVADNILEDNKYIYPGTIGTSIAKVFDLTVAATGLSSKVLNRECIEHISSFTHGSSHAGYYPGASQLSVKVNFSPLNGKLLGAQVVGKEGADKRIELFSEVIKKGGTIYDLMDIEHAYAPPYSSAKDPVNMAGFVADNILKGKMKVAQWRDIGKINLAKTTLLDVRTSEECSEGYIKGAMNIPLDELRSRIKEIPKEKDVLIYCAVGLRGYIASRILAQYGFSNVLNLSGGYTTYATAIAEYSL